MREWFRGDRPRHRHFQLEADRIVMTCELLLERISYRLPGRNLVGVAWTLRQAAGQAVHRAEAIQRPNIALRVIEGVLVLGMVAVVVKVMGYLHFTDASGWDILEGIDAGVSTMIYLGLATIFVMSLETRLRRRKALRAIHELRALAHVVDMHQLGKDPERLTDRYGAGDEYGSEPLDPSLLGRYLDYCSDLLSLIGKVAVLYGNKAQDAVVLNAVDEVERLTTGLSGKIWQKIMILDQILAGKPTTSVEKTRAPGIEVR